MKRHAAMLVRAYLILLVAITIIPPLHARALYGTVNINGRVTYQPRNWNPQLNNWAIGKEIQIDLYEKDLQGNEHRYRGNRSYISELCFFKHDDLLIP